MSPELAERARHLATQAREPFSHYEHTTVGYNYRLSNLLAALGRAQLRGLDGRVERRKQIDAAYTDGLAGLPGVSPMPRTAAGTSNYWLTCILIDPESLRGGSRARAFGPGGSGHRVPTDVEAPPPPTGLRRGHLRGARALRPGLRPGPVPAHRVGALARRPVPGHRDHHRPGPRLTWDAGRRYRILMGMDTGGNLRATAGEAEGPGLLSPSVPPHPRERRMVGQGLHRVAQRDQGPPAVSRSLSAPPPGRARLLRLAGARGADRTGRIGPRARRARLRLLPLLVPRPPAAGAAVRRSAGVRRAGLPLRTLLGQRGVDPGLGLTDGSCARAPGVQRGGRSRPHPRPPASVQGSSLHHHRRSTAHAHLPADADP